MFSFLSLINNYVIIGLIFLLLSISVIMSSNTTNILRFFSGLFFNILIKIIHTQLNIQ